MPAHFDPQIHEAFRRVMAEFEQIYEADKD
jgi:hypothetical protein